MAPPAGVRGGFSRSLVPQLLLSTLWALLHPLGVFITPRPLDQLPLCTSSPYTFHATLVTEHRPGPFMDEVSGPSVASPAQNAKAPNCIPSWLLSSLPRPCFSHSPEPRGHGCPCHGAVPSWPVHPLAPGALVASSFPFLCLEFFFWSLVRLFSGAGLPVMNSVHLFPANILVFPPFKEPVPWVWNSRLAVFHSPGEGTSSISRRG